MSDQKTICMTAITRGDICIGWNEESCVATFDSGQVEEEVCATVQKNQKIEEAFKTVLADKCKPFASGIGPHSLHHKQAWLCELKKK